MKIEDYSGQFVGMPTVIADLLEAADDFARTSRWIAGADGLVDLLETREVQLSHFGSADPTERVVVQGQTATVQKSQQGVPLRPLPPKPEGTYAVVFFDNATWLHAAALHP